MRRLLIALVLVFTASTANAVTFLTSTPTSHPGVFDFGEVPVGEMREELLVFDVSGWFSVTPLDIPRGVPGAVSASRETFATWRGIKGNPAYEAIGLDLVDCGANGGPGDFCINAKLTSSFDLVPVSSVRFQRTFNDTVFLADGNSFIFGGNDTDFFTLVTFTPTPVPVPATLPLLLGGLMTLLFWHRRA